jgi:hypothetical protein
VFDGGAYPPTVRLVDIASGKDLGSADLLSVGVDGVDSIQFLGYGGDWVGEYAVAESDVGLVRLHIVGVHVSVSDVMAFKRSAFPIQPHEPQFLTGSDSKVYAWAPMDSGNVRTYRYLICNFATTSCDVGDVDTNDNMFAEVHNPSRPLSGHG